MATCDDCVLWSNLARRRRPLSVSCPRKMQRRKRCAIGMCFVVIFEKKSSIAREIVEFIEEHGARSVVMTNGILIGCPHQEGIDYHGEWSRFASSGVDAIALRGRCFI